MNEVNILCIPAANKMMSVSGNEIIFYSHLYYMVKIVDLLDTVSAG